MMKGFIAEMPDRHQVIQTLATNIDEAAYYWREVYLSLNEFKPFHVK